MTNVGTAPTATEIAIFINFYFFPTFHTYPYALLSSPVIFGIVLLQALLADAMRGYLFNPFYHCFFTPCAYCFHITPFRFAREAVRKESENTASPAKSRSWSRAHPRQPIKSFNFKDRYRLLSSSHLIRTVLPALC